MKSVSWYIWREPDNQAWNQICGRVDDRISDQIDNLVRQRLLNEAKFRIWDQISWEN